jgi:hypothetical protein
MWFLLFMLLVFHGLVGVVIYFAWQRLTAHMRKNPEAAKLVAEHVIAPLLIGRKEETPSEETRNGVLQESD